MKIYAFAATTRKMPDEREAYNLFRAKYYVIMSSAVSVSHSHSGIRKVICQRFQAIKQVNLFRAPSVHKVTYIVLLFVLCANTNAVYAQGNQDDDVVRVESNLVQLNVGVVDRKGNAVTDLSTNDFVVYEDGVRQTITSFEPAATPFSLVLLLDLSGSTLNFRTTLKQAALRFIDALSPEDRVAVIAFDEKAQTLADFTVDRRKIAYAIDRAEGRKPTTEFYKALRYSLDQLKREGKRRKAIVVMTDGIDTNLRKADTALLAGATTNEEALAAIKPEANSALNGVLDMADRLGATIYPLQLPSADVKRLPLPSPQLIGIYSSANKRLETLANRTGGRLHAINRLEDMGRLYAEVAADMRTLYTISYQPGGSRPRDGRWRAIKIEVKRTELLARTREGYYAR
ncbi:MAG: VWA domain-containing protein, partial [Pyrinomonadaceae bacterium]|nr:VWA domain-containing protein [Pyrinomonadaceae bacterium]